MAPTNLRSVSISSSSTTSSKSSSDGIKKKFSCSHPNCGKSFSRSEHLHRHALNHKEGNNTCLRCSAHFRRRDLLDRHMSRHKEKDDEAGGEGLGVLATRKRLWRDADGKIVNARRPSYTPEMGGNKRRMINKGTAGRDSNSKISTQQQQQQQQILTTTLPPSPASMSRAGSTHSTIVVDTSSSGSRHQIYTHSSPQPTPQEEEIHHHHQHHHNHHNRGRPWYQMSGPALLSPSTSSSSSYSDHGSLSSLHSEAQSPSAELDTLYEDAWPLGAPSLLPEIVNHHSGSPLLLGARESEYPANPGWGGPQPSFQTFMGAIGEFEDVAPPPPLKEVFSSGGVGGAGALGVYGWQNPNPWSAGGSQMMLSRCREEKFEGGVKFEGVGERVGEFSHSEVLRRGFGLGGC